MTTIAHGRTAATRDILSFLDVTGPCEAIWHDLSGVSAPISLLMMVPVAAALAFFAFLAWQFDIASTHHWASALVLQVGAGDSFAQSLFPIVVVVAAFIPTILELFLSRFASAADILRPIVYLAILFDGWTDWPVMSNFADRFLASHHVAMFILILLAIKAVLVACAVFGFAI